MSNRPIEIPDRIAEMLAALARHKQITEGELVVRILTKALDDPLLEPYVNHGRFDQVRFERDMMRDNNALMQWYAEHPNELDWVGDVTLHPGERRRKAS